uniref:Uncharacterized protein LOC108038179 n=1 Tax=Drosophila rhopaloa TaxID=1041015 RepID=A0A6P4DXJ4_DRORH
MHGLHCIIFLICGVLFAESAVPEDYKKDAQHNFPNEVKDLDESIERIRRQIGAFGVGIGVFGERHVGPLGNPYYGNPYGNPYFVQPYGHYFHDRRFGGGFPGNFYGR